MSVTLRFIVEDIDTQIATYESIRVYRASSLTGTYSVIDTVTLVGGNLSIYILYYES